MTSIENVTDADPRAILGRAFATARTVLDGIVRRVERPRPPLTTLLAPD